MVRYNEFEDCSQLVISPNRSASWKEVKLISAIIALATGTIAVGWALVGVWVILPFAGFEVLLVFGLMYAISINSTKQQVLTINDSTILVSEGRSKPNQQWRFIRRSCFLQYITPRHPDDSPSLYIKDDQCSVQIGSFLNQKDAFKLVSKLEGAGIMVVRDQWWKPQSY